MEEFCTELDPQSSQPAVRPHVVRGGVKASSIFEQFTT